MIAVNTQRVCAACHTVATEGAGYCANCGTSLFAADEQPAPVQQLPTPAPGTKTWLFTGGVSLAMLLAILLLVQIAKENELSSEPSADQRLVAKAEADVRSHLKDPNSAEFENVSAMVAGNCVIGRVIGKNGFGASTGYHGFVWKPGHVVFEEEAGLLPFVDAQNACVDAELNAKAASNKAQTG